MAASTTPTPRPPRSTPRPTCRSTRRTRPTPWRPARTSATPSTSQTAAPSGAHNVKVVDTLPAGVTFVSASGGATWSCAYSIITKQGHAADLTRGPSPPAPAAATITVTVKAPNEPEVLSNSATGVLHAPATRWPPTTPTPTPPRSTPRPTCRSTRTTRPTPCGRHELQLHPRRLKRRALGRPQRQGRGHPAGRRHVRLGLGGATWSCAPQRSLTDKVTCDLTGTLASGASAATITVDGEGPERARGPVQTSATASSTTSDPVAANNTDTETTTVNASADLSIDKQRLGRPRGGRQRTSATPSTSQTAGPSAPTTSRSWTPCRPASTFVSASGGATWSCAYSIITNKVTCDLTGTLASGASAATITVTGEGPERARGPVQRATVSSTTSDPVAANNTDTETTTVNALGRPVDRQEGLGRPRGGRRRTSATPSTSQTAALGRPQRQGRGHPAGRRHVRLGLGRGHLVLRLQHHHQQGHLRPDRDPRLRRLGRHDHRHGEGPERARGPVQLGHRVLHDERPGGRQQHRHRDHHGQRLGRPVDRQEGLGRPRGGRHDISATPSTSKRRALGRPQRQGRGHPAGRHRRFVSASGGATCSAPTASSPTRSPAT